MPLNTVKSMLKYGFNFKQALIRELDSSTSIRPNLFVSQRQHYSELHKNLFYQLILDIKANNESLTAFFQALNANVGLVLNDTTLRGKLSKYFSCFPELSVFLSDDIERSLSISFDWIAKFTQHEVWQTIQHIENFNLICIMGKENDKQRLLKHYSFLAAVDFEIEIDLMETLITQSLLTLSKLYEAETENHNRRLQKFPTATFGSTDLQFFDLTISSLLANIAAYTNTDNIEKIISTILIICKQHCKHANSRLSEQLPKFYPYANPEHQQAIVDVGIENTKTDSMNYLIFFYSLFLGIKDKNEKIRIFDKLTEIIDVKNPDDQIITRCQRIAKDKSLPEISRQSSSILTNSLLALLNAAKAQPHRQTVKTTIREVCDKLIEIYDKVADEDKLNIKLNVKLLANYTFIYPAAYITLLAMDSHAQLDVCTELNELKAIYHCKDIINIVNNVHPHLLELLVKMYGEDNIEIPSIAELDNREADIPTRKLEPLIKSPSLKLLSIENQKKIITKYIKEILKHADQYTAHIIATLSLDFTIEQKSILVSALEKTLFQEIYPIMVNQLLFELVIDTDRQKAEQLICIDALETITYFKDPNGSTAQDSGQSENDIIDYLLQGKTALREVNPCDRIKLSSVSNRYFLNKMKLQGQGEQKNINQDGAPDATALAANAVIASAPTPRMG